MTLRLGVDVGGTFTKAVAVQADPVRLVAQAVTPTTHTASEGVARGIVDVLHSLLSHPEVPPERVSLVAHSTTQAVNALLEGDTAAVGIVGMGAGRDAGEAARRTRIGNIALAPGRALRTEHCFADTSDGFSLAAALRAVENLSAQGAQAIVASEAFSVDDPAHELLVLEAARQHGIPAVASHQLSGVYGLEIRTLTAAINASLLPKMLQTAELVARCLREANIHAPLMVMRGDGGLTDLATLHTRPILTLFSGPSASLVGALLSGGIVDGVFIEVGGTSTNLGVVRGGAPEISYVRVMDRPTCVRSLDVRVQGIAGGSLPRVRGRKISDVGPRSAHIAGLPYASLASTDSGPLEVELIAPRAGDPADYAVVKAASGQVFALTLTCAANALGLVPEGAYAAGSREAALRGFEALGRVLGCDAPSAARQMLNLAAKRVAEAVDELAKEYKLRRHAFQLIGGGGGAGALVPAVAERLGVPFRLAEHAEVISSLGDALASAREVVERTMESGLSVEALAREAEAAVLRSGAEAESVQVIIERDEERGLVRAVATGSVALLAAGVHTQIDEPAARSLAAQTANSSALELLCDTGGFWVYQVKGGLMRRAQTIAVDRRGLLRLHSSGGKTLAGERGSVLTQLRKHLDTLDLVGRQPSVKLLAGARLLDLGASGTAEGMMEAARAVTVDEETSKRVVVIVE